MVYPKIVLPFLCSPSSHSGPRLPSPQLKISRASNPLQVHYLRCVCYTKLGIWVCKHGYWQNLSSTERERVRGDAQMRYSITRPAKRIVAGLISVRYLKGQITTVDCTVLSHTHYNFLKFDWCINGFILFP